MSEAAKAQYLGTEEARRGVQTSLIADVASGYFELRELDLQLAIANQTKGNAQNGLKLATVRHDRGAATALDVRQAEQFLYTATAQIAAIEREIGQQENAISVLLGNNPGEIPRGKTLEELKAPPEVPAGLPSALLDRRPDIRQAEESLVAANANIGAAKALYFPRYLPHRVAWPAEPFSDPICLPVRRGPGRSSPRTAPFRSSTQAPSGPPSSTPKSRSRKRSTAIRRRFKMPSAKSRIL